MNYGLMSDKIYGIRMPLFLLILAPVLIALYLDLLPHNLITALAVTMGIGGLLFWLGNRIPLVSDFGGGTILCLLLPAILIYYGIFPQSLMDISEVLYSEFGFADLIVAGLIAGSILSIRKEVLVKIGMKMLIPVFSAIILGTLVGGIIGMLFGFGFIETMLMVVAPIMASGITTGALPLSEIYASNMGGASIDYFDILAPAVMVANIICIILAAILNFLGKKNANMFLKGFSGNGQTLRNTEDTFDDGNSKSKLVDNIQNIGIGLFIAGGLYVLGVIMNAVVPSLHTFVWIIIFTAILKLSNVLPEYINDGTEVWFQFINKIWVPALLVAISASLIDINMVMTLLTDPSRMLLTILVVIAISIAAGITGWLIGFYFIESSIIGGLALADMGGTGDIAVLKASERMTLYPFLQITTRIGGVLTLVIMSFLSTFG